ncbi:MAG: DinB family protein, partial [Planctomycetota bacterium]
MKATLQSFQYSLAYLCEQVEDIDAAEMVRRPKGITIHPAWIIGHLTFSCQAIGGEFGLSPWLPDEWAGKFGGGSTPVENEAEYPGKRESLSMLDDARTRVVQAVGELSETQFDQALPDETFRAVLPTVRHAITQVLVGHTAYHVGQVSLWRAAMG